MSPGRCIGRCVGRRGRTLDQGVARLAVAQSTTSALTSRPVYFCIGPTTREMPTKRRPGPQPQSSNRDDVASPARFVSRRASAMPRCTPSSSELRAPPGLRCRGGNFDSWGSSVMVVDSPIMPPSGSAEGIVSVGCRTDLLHLTSWSPVALVSSVQIWWLPLCVAGSV